MRILLAMLMMAVLVGCKRPNSDNPPPKDPTPIAKAPEKKAEVTPTPPPTKPKDPGKPDLISTIARNREVPDLGNRLRQIGLTYHAMMAEGKAPASLAELKRELKIGGEFWEPFDKGWIKIIYGARTQTMTAGSSNTLLAYEEYPDRLGYRLTLMGDGSVQKLTNEEFEKAPKAVGK